VLVLTVKKGESVMIDNEIKIQILGYSRGRAKIGIEAPKDKIILREKLILRDKLIGGSEIEKDSV